MKKAFTRLLSLCCVFAMLFCFEPLTAHASTTKSKSVNGPSNFDSEWEKTTTYKINGAEIGIMIYGYDKDYINEDFVWTVGYECSTQPYVFRDGHDTSDVAGSLGQTYLYGKVEVKHQTYNVTYKIKFSATYNGSSITSSTENSTVKI